MNGEKSSKKGLLNLAKKVASLPVEAVKSLGNVAKSGWEHPKTTVGICLAIGAVVIGEKATWGNSMDEHKAKKYALTDQDMKRGARCFSDGFILRAGAVVRRSPALVDSRLGPVSSVTGLWEGNVDMVIDEGKTQVVRQPRIWEEGKNQWMVFTKGKAGGKTQSVKGIADSTYVVNLQPYRDESINAQKQTAITTYDVRSSQGSQSFNMVCDLKTNGQTIAVDSTGNEQLAAYAIGFDGNGFPAAQDLQE